jgi:hypothetical protein
LATGGEMIIEMILGKHHCERMVENAKCNDSAGTGALIKIMVAKP